MSAIRRHLAAATADRHAALDGHARTLDAGALVAFIAGGIVAIEAALDRAGAARLLPEWPQRRRGHLVVLPGGAAPSTGAAAPPRFASAAQAWGALYVLEGSRLGGRVLAADPALAAHPLFSEPVPFWATFNERLAAADAALDDRPGMVAGACAAFHAFL